jgi:hypothetical protein
MTLTMALAGLRIGEATALRVEDFDELRGDLKVDKAYAEVAGRLILGPTKTGEDGKIALPPVVVSAIKSHLREFGPGKDGLLFAAPEGGPLPRSRFRRVWTELSIGLVWITSRLTVCATSPCPLPSAPERRSRRRQNVPGTTTPRLRRGSTPTLSAGRLVRWRRRSARHSRKPRGDALLSRTCQPSLSLARHTEPPDGGQPAGGSPFYMSS